MRSVGDVFVQMCGPFEGCDAYLVAFPLAEPCHRSIMKLFGGPCVPKRVPLRALDLLGVWPFWPPLYQKR